MRITPVAGIDDPRVADYRSMRRFAALRIGRRFVAEGTRVADKLLIIDLPRPPAPLHVMRLAAMLPLAPFVPFVHDGVISSLRAYSPAALRALAERAGVDIELRGGLCTPQIAIATRR